MTHSTESGAEKNAHLRIAIILVALNLLVSNALGVSELFGELPIQFLVLRLVVVGVAAFYLVRQATWALVVSMVYFGWVILVWGFLFEAGSFSELPVLLAFIDPVLSVMSLGVLALGLASRSRPD